VWTMLPIPRFTVCLIQTSIIQNISLSICNQEKKNILNSKNKTISRILYYIIVNYWMLWLRIQNNCNLKHKNKRRNDVIGLSPINKYIKVVGKLMKVNNCTFACICLIFIHFLHNSDPYHAYIHYTNYTNVSWKGMIWLTNLHVAVSVFFLLFFFCKVHVDIFINGIYIYIQLFNNCRLLLDVTLIYINLCNYQNNDEKLVKCIQT